MAKNSTKRSSTAKKAPDATRPSEDQIARLAYQKFEERGRVHGFEMDDWLSAEAELVGQGARPNG